MIKGNIFFFFIFLFAGNVFGQVQENFDDGDFKNNPTWNGDTLKFQVTTGFLNSTSQVLNDTFYLSTASTYALDAEWHVSLELNFSTSSNNLVDVYLTSSQENLKSSLNGYFVRVGDTKDDISLYRRDGNTVTKLIDGTDGRSQAGSPAAISLKVTRTAAGLFTLYDDNAGGSNYVSEGTVTDATHNTSAYFGISVKQSTASFFGKHLFDNIYAGPIIIDNTPPSILSVTVIPSNKLDVHFSEPVEQTSAETVKNYSVSNGIGIPVTALVDGSDASLVHLFFSNNFLPGSNYILSVDSVKDLVNNVPAAGATTYSFYIPKKYDLLINEIMADPDPAVTLPAAEYIELFNNSTFPVDLGGWTYSDATATQQLPSVILKPDSFLIICASSNVNLFTPYGKIVGLLSFPSLNNDSDSLKLKDGNGVIISSVNYSDAWYQDEIKKAGGWSLELIDPDNPCASNNWKASADASGGTPGRKNSVFGNNPDTQAPELIKALITDSVHLTLFFNEPMDPATLTKQSAYSVDNGIGGPKGALTIIPYTEVILEFTNQFQKNTTYHVTVTTLRDCSGNLIGAANDIAFAIPQSPDSNDVVINEILYNPASGGFDYLELFNRSEKIIDLKDLFVTTRDDTGAIENLETISAGYLLFPRSYVVLTENPDWVKSHYTVNDPNALIQVTDLPSFNDDEGVVVLTTGNKKVMDELRYSDDWQFSLIDNTEGVSLERISPDAVTQDSMNWHSAASTAGYGTPTYRNSQFTDVTVTSDDITIDPQVFSPDQDGHDDVAIIKYRFSQPGYLGNVKVYDKEGRLIRDLVQNQLLAQTGFFTWDGTADNGSRGRVGIYVVYTEVFDVAGTVKKTRKSCVLAGKSN